MSEDESGPEPEDVPRFAFLLTQGTDVPSHEEIESANDGLWPGEPLTGSFQVGAIDGPVPEGEAQHAAAFSVASLGNAKALAPHSAHIVLIYTPADDLSAVGELQAFTRVLAALLVASGAQAVYWGDAGASHPAGFFVEFAQNVELPLPLWSGVSRWRLPDGRFGLLSLGMAQLGMLDLFVTAPADQATEALGFFYDLLTYVAERGSVLRAGETTGRSEDEELVVYHRPSPDDDTLTVFAVDLP